MIHTLYVSAETEPAELKKQMRKKLMTGGAVVRLGDELSADELGQIFNRFSPVAERHSVAAEVLVQLAGKETLAPELRESLAALGIPEVNRALGAQTNA